MKPWTGDLDGMIERREIRILTVFYKYYIAYKLIMESKAERAQAAEQMKGASQPVR